MRWTWRRSPVTPGVTGERRRCAPATGACNTRCYRRLHRSQLSTDCILPSTEYIVQLYILCSFKCWYLPTSGRCCCRCRRGCSCGAPWRAVVTARRRHGGGGGSGAGSVHVLADLLLPHRLDAVTGTVGAHGGEGDHSGDGGKRSGGHWSSGRRRRRRHGSRLS